MDDESYNKKGLWSVEEDQLLKDAVDFIPQNMFTWISVAEHVPSRTAKQCRERWRDHLDPDLNKEPFSKDEKAQLKELVQIYGSSWARIARKMHNRSPAKIKNYCQRYLRDYITKQPPQQNKIAVNTKDYDDSDIYSLLDWVEISEMLDAYNDDTVVKSLDLKLDHLEEPSPILNKSKRINVSIIDRGMSPGYSRRLDFSGFDVPSNEEKSNSPSLYCEEEFASDVSPSFLTLKHMFDHFDDPLKKIDDKDCVMIANSMLTCA